MGLWPFLSGGQTNWPVGPRHVLVEDSPSGTANSIIWSIKRGRYVYTEYANGNRELYDLLTDSAQVTSRHASSSHARVRQQLATRLAAMKTCSGPTLRGQYSADVRRPSRAGPYTSIPGQGRQGVRLGLPSRRATTRPPSRAASDLQLTMNSPAIASTFSRLNGSSKASEAASALPNWLRSTDAWVVRSSPA